MGTTLHAFEPDYAIHPGASLLEYIEYENLTDKGFATHLGITVQHLRKICKGQSPITPVTANALEKVIGTKASFWNNLQLRYDEYQAKEKENQDLTTQIEWLNHFPLSDLRKRFICTSKNKTEILQELMSFFGVANPKAWGDCWMQPEAAARRSNAFNNNPYIAATWLRLGELRAKKILNDFQCCKTDKKAFKECLTDIRILSTEVNDFIPRLTELCREAGVIFVLVPEMKRLTWSGATKWIGDNAIIMLNLRGKREDKFWFSFFHEASHVINDSKKDLFINDNNIEDKKEIRANDFASEMLFKDKRPNIKMARSQHDLYSIAYELEISVGIVAGQYQYLTSNYRFYSQLIKTFKWQE